jgi:hypothetical protein
MPDKTPTIFISYSRKDHACLEELLKALRPTLANVTAIQAWADDEVRSGEHWDDKIRQALDAARAAVLLISNDFLDSRFIREEELPVLLPREQDRSLRLFAVYVSAVTKPALKVPLVPGDPTRIYDLLKIQAENYPDRSLERMDAAERNALFVGLAEKLYAFAETLKPASASGSPASHRMSLASPRGIGSGAVRPDCLIRLHRDGAGVGRSFLLPGHQRWLSPELQAPDALDALALWQPGLPFDGDLLFELLFGNDPAGHRDLLSDPYGDARGGAGEPSRQPWRVRLLIEDGDPLLQCLPWTRIAHLGIPLTESGWTVELSPSAPAGVRPELPNHAFIMPGRILLVFPEAEEDPAASAHLRDVQGLIQQLWDRPAPFFIAADSARLGAYLRDYSPRLVYYYGGVERAGGEWRLKIPDGAGGWGLGFAALKGMFSSVPPSAMFFNLLGDEASEVMPDTAVLAEPPACKLLALQATPRGEAERAQRSAMAWLEGVLRDDKRLDPVSALHANGHAFAACRAAYHQWDPQLGEAHLDEDLAHLLLDRTRQRSRLLQARDDFFDLSSKLRVQCFLAVGTRGNRVADFPQQAITHLQIHAKPGVHAYLGHVELQPTDTDPDRLETRYRRRLGLRPSAGLAEGLRPAQVRHSNEYLLPLLAWTLAGDATAEQRTAVARAIVRWSRERIAVACPDDLRVVSLIALETEDADELEDLREAIEGYDEELTAGQEYRRTAGFRFEVLDPLSGVRKRDLRHYFDSEFCTCPDGLRLEYPGLLLGERGEMSFEEAVALIREARDRGWHAMKADLQNHS